MRNLPDETRRGSAAGALCGPPMPPSTRLPNLPSVPKRSGSATDRTHAAAERRPAGAAGRPGAQTDRGHAAERQRPSGAAGRSGAQTDRGRYSQTLQPGTEEFYSFYLQRRKEEKPSESYGWSDADQNSVVRPWLDDKERRRARAQDSERKRADADKKMLLDLKYKSRKRNKEEAKSLMTELHRWIAGMTTRMEQNAGTKLSERSKFARRRDQMRLRQFVARLLEFTNVLAKGDVSWLSPRVASSPHEKIAHRSSSAACLTRYARSIKR